jgi:hypothetical protein
VSWCGLAQTDREQVDRRATDRDSRVGYPAVGAEGEPRCSAVGTYTGQVKHDGGTWRWIAHEVRTVAPYRPDSSTSTKNGDA